MTKEFRLDINGLRAFAVIAVVLYHFGVPGITGGFVGVDVFFVISGFLMTQIIMDKLRAGKFTIAGFYAARARRIIPALAVLVIIVSVFGYFYLSPLDYKVLGKHAASSVTFLSNFIYWQESDYFDTVSHVKWLLHTWSLSVEWQFYIFYPVFLLALYRFKAGKYLLPAIWILLVLSFGISIGQSLIDTSGAFYLLPSRIWEFLLGGLVYFYPVTVRESVRKFPLSEVLIVISVLLYTVDLSYPGAWPLLPVLATALAIRFNSLSPLLTNRVAQFFGAISYSLYLWHWPIFVGARYFNVPFTLENIVLFFVIATVLAYLSYRFVESRFRSVSPAISNFKYLLRYAVAIVIVTIPAALVWASQGIIGRAPEVHRGTIVANQKQLTNWQYPGNCKFENDFCMIGDTKSEKILFWGDSHAQQWYPLYETLTKNDKTNSYQIMVGGVAGCPPIRTVERIKSGFDCVPGNERTYQRVMQDDVKKVVFTSIWTTYFRDDLFAGNHLPNICNAANGCQKYNSSEDAVIKAGQVLLNDIKSIRAAGKDVYLLLPIPIYHDSVPNLVSRQIFLHGRVTLNKSNEEHQGYTQPVNELLRNIAKQTGAIVLDPATILCDTGQCINHQQGVSVYKDSNHIVSEVTLWFEPLFTRIFKRTASGEK